MSRKLSSLICKPRKQSQNEIYQKKPGLLIINPAEIHVNRKSPVSVQIYFITYLENSQELRDKSKGFKGYFSAIKRNTVLSFEINMDGYYAKWDGSQRDTHMIPIFICGI